MRLQSGNLKLHLAVQLMKHTYENIAATTTPWYKSNVECVIRSISKWQRDKIKRRNFDSDRCIGIGSTTAIIKDTTLANVTINLTSSAKTKGIYDIVGNLGLDTLTIENLLVNYASSAVCVPVEIGQYFNGNNDCGKIFISNVVVKHWG